MGAWVHGCMSRIFSFFQVKSMDRIKLIVFASGTTTGGGTEFENFGTISPHLTESKKVIPCWYESFHRCREGAENDKQGANHPSEFVA